MRNNIAAFAASVPLLLIAAGASAGDLQFQTPTTARAQEMQPLLNRAAHALQDKVGVTAGGGISNLWLFPTGDDHTVFAQYTVTGEKTSPQVHLEILQIKDDRIVAERDLTRSADDGALSAQQDGDESAPRSDVAGS